MPHLLEQADQDEIERRWERLCRAAGLGRAGVEMRAMLFEAYGGAERHYHHLGHVLECLRQLDEFEAQAESPTALTLALWWHDAVYDTHRSDSEQASAALAYEHLRRAGVSDSTAMRVHDLVLATRHAADPGTPDARLLVDIDLSILGQPPEVFDRYEAAVRREYAWVPDELFGHAAPKSCRPSSHGQGSSCSRSWRRDSRSLRATT